VAGLNEIIRGGRLRPLVEESLAVYEASLDEAAGKVMARLHAGDPLRMMWISGPSSSGKTTTTVKLTERLERQGLRFLMLNLDDYFWSLVEHPTDWINDRNYETPEALDIQLLNRHLTDLLAGRTIDKPIYSFKEGRGWAASPCGWSRSRFYCSIVCTDCIRRSRKALRRGRSSGFYIETLNPLYEGMVPVNGWSSSPTCAWCGGCCVT
jgi:hypothetical protein